MLKIRVIPVLSFNGFGLIKTKQFGTHRMVGNPIQAARVYNSRGVDELIFVDIHASRQNRKLNTSLVSEILRECFMPVTVGGGISTIEDVQELFRIGADKVVVKTAMLLNPNLISEASRAFGAQAICVAIDALRSPSGEYMIHNHLGIERSMESVVRAAEKIGAGEIFVNAVAHDGMMNGMDAELCAAVRSLTSLPVIFCGGAGEPQHFVDLYQKIRVDAVAAASIFHFTQYTPLDIKRALKAIEVPVRLVGELPRV